MGGGHKLPNSSFDWPTKRGSLHNRTDYLEKGLAEGVKNVEAATDAMNAGAKRIPSSVPVKGDFYGVTSLQVGAVVGGVPVLVVLLMLWFTGMFSRVPKDDFEQLQAQNAAVQAKYTTLQKMNDILDEENKFYLKNISRHVAKDKKSAADFPAYKRME